MPQSRLTTGLLALAQKNNNNNLVWIAIQKKKLVWIAILYTRWHHNSVDSNGLCSNATLHITALDLEVNLYMVLLN